MRAIFAEFEVFDGRFRCRIISYSCLESCIVDKNKTRALSFYVYCRILLSIINTKYSVFQGILSFFLSICLRVIKSAYISEFVQAVSVVL